MLMSLILALTPNLTGAQTIENETHRFTIVMHQQNCFRPDVSEAFLCTAEPNRAEQVEVQLKNTPTGPLESAASAGESDYVRMIPAGRSNQYLPRLRIMKSVGKEGGPAIYTLRFRTFAIGGVIASEDVSASAFETLYFAEGSPELVEPLALMADRIPTGPNSFKQISFTVKSVTQSNRGPRRTL